MSDVAGASTPNRLSDILVEAGLIDRLGESIPGLVYVYDRIEQRNAFTNRPLAELLGYAPDQVAAMGDQVLSRIIHPDDMPRVQLHHAEMAGLRDGQVVEIEYRVRTATGDWIWLHSWESVLSRTQGGETRQFLGIAHDVTARVRAEEELRDSQRRLSESEQRWRSIGENPFDFVVVIDRDYKFTFVNFVAPGVEMDSLIGKATPLDFVSKEDHPGMLEAYSKVFNEGCAAAYEVYVPQLDKWYSSICGPIRDGDVVTHASVLTRDITTEKRMQQQALDAERKLRAMELKLAHSAKLEALGQLAGGIAHDFNNLLMGISGIADLLADRLPPSAENATDLDELRRAVGRGSGLTRQLLAFCRQQPLAQVVVDVGELLDNAASLLRRLLQSDIQLELSKGDTPLCVRGDRSQLEQVVLNLALNARDAMPGGGRLRFTLTTLALGPDAQQEHPDARPGSYVQLRVEDSGIGIDPATQARIFEPFFTTKPLGAGTGLGLSLVHGIVQQTGGFITVRSSPGHGATFEINLPQCEPDGSTTQLTLKPALKGLPRAEAIIFLVEDDPLASRLVRRLLEGLGYTVESEERGDAALARIEAGLKFDLLLTDVLLPGMDGHALFQRARRLRPNLRAVLMSGYTAEVFAARGIADIGTHFLAKPFTQSELAGTLEAALSARPVE